MSMSLLKAAEVEDSGNRVGMVTDHLLRYTSESLDVGVVNGTLQLLETSDIPSAREVIEALRKPNGERDFAVRKILDDHVRNEERMLSVLDEVVSILIGTKPNQMMVPYILQVLNKFDFIIQYTAKELKELQSILRSGKTPSHDALKAMLLEHGPRLKSSSSSIKQGTGQVNLDVKKVMRG